ncbi:MAG: hypothetical protein M1820_007464 [Bogoriella megaspora]|nr:MAG: hypothetical protein M1820_007464 [Bogoriella megaspora]
MAQQLILPDERVVDYLISGANNGFPLLFVHGTPGSYLPVPSFASACEKKGIKILTLSRAGYGGSTRKKGRRVVDMVSDIQALLQHLGIKRCFVGGWSGGGPHALACAARLPECVATLCIAGVAPADAEDLDFLAGQGEDNIQEFQAAMKGEEALAKFCGDMRLELLNTDARGIVESMSSILPDVDKQALLEDSTMGQYCADLFQEGLKSNADGWVDDDLEFVQPWGFDLSEVKVPVLLYQGSEDKMVPYAHGEWLSKHLPQEKLISHLQQGQGHISIVVTHTEDMLDELLAIPR